jgi:hypothetical protein
MTPGLPAFDTRRVPKKDPLLGEIAALLAVSDGLDDPERLERTLTDGYARALSLEGEQRRLERRIGSLAAGRGDPEERRELASLVRLARRRQGDLGALRGQLGELRRRHSSAVRRAS